MARDLIDGHFGVWFDSVSVNNVPIDPAHSQKVWNHSPDGFAWGYGGSGPAQLALAILLLFADEDTAVKLHQRFTTEFIAPLPQGDFTLALNVKGWIENA